MKSTIFILFLFPSILSAKEISPQLKEPRIAIQEIHDRSATSARDACGSYGVWSTPGDAVRELLIDELLKIGGVTLVEREKLSSIYENEMKQENLDETTVVEKKRFIAANLAVAGALSEFEWCISGGEDGLNVGDLFGINELSVKHKDSKAHVAMDLRLIDVKTGRIIKTVKGEGRVEDSGYSFDLDVHNVRLSQAEFEKTPLGKATRTAVSQAAQQIASAAKEFK